MFVLMDGVEVTVAEKLGDAVTVVVATGHCCVSRWYFEPEFPELNNNNWSQDEVDLYSPYCPDLPGSPLCAVASHVSAAATKVSGPINLVLFVPEAAPVYGFTPSHFMVKELNTPFVESKVDASLGLQPGPQPVPDPVLTIT